MINIHAYFAVHQEYRVLTHPHEEFLAAAESGGVDEDAEDVAADDGYGIDEADEGWLKVVDSSMPTIKLQKIY